MTKQQAKQRIEKLKKLINRHRYLYHVLDRQEISEPALDFLKKELFDLEQHFPEFITPDSPTQRVGGKPLEKFKKVKHPQPMLSFNDAFSEKDMEDWQDRNSKLLTKEEIENIDYYCEPKIDGLAIELIYKNGILEIGSTRGDGFFGEDVTQNLKTIEAIPLRLREINDAIKDLEKDSNPPTTSSHPSLRSRWAPGLKEVIQHIKEKGLKEIIVRGEIIITKKDFKEVNKNQEKLGFPTFANPRNLAAGSIRQLDPKITASRRLDSIVYDLVTDLGQKNHSQEHKILKTLGFKTNNKYSKYCQKLEYVFNFHNFWSKNREKLPYEIDGIVVQVNNNKVFKKLAAVGKAPRGAIAYKFPLKQATTIVEDIKVQIGRTGAITPVAHLKPVEVGGTTITRATLHNQGEIKRLGIKIGDTVIVGRAGDVIPDIVKVLAELRTGKEKNFKMPEKCPACGTKLTKPIGEAIWRCPNPKCFTRQREYFYHFISKNAFNIVGLGPKIIDKLIDAGLVSDAADLFRLEIGDIIFLERLPRRKPKAFLRGFAEKSAQNLISAIQSKKKITFPRFIYALGIRNVGEETAQDLAEYFNSIEKLKKASFEELQKITDIGPVVAKSIYNYFQKKRNLEFLEKLKNVGIEIFVEKIVNLQPLKGKIFILTGALNTMSREEAKRKIRLLGGEISESVSRRTDYVVIGKEPGSKFEKAKKLGIKIISEKELLKLIKTY